MSVPTTYDNLMLADYQERVIGPLAGILELSVDSNSFEESVRNTLIAMDIDDAEGATDIPLLRAYAEREAWRLVRDYTVAYYDMRSPDGEQLSRSQIYRQATERLHDAEQRVAELSSTAAVRAYTVSRSPDPYRRADS